MSFCPRRLHAIGLVMAAVLLPRLPSAAEWPGYEKLTREQVVAALAKASASAPADLYSRNLSGLDLSGIDFKGANLAAAVLNRSNLASANLSRCNLTVSFAEGTNLANANLQGAMMFSMQLQGANLKGANLSGARLIGDLRRVNLEQAVLAKVDGAADMKNQSMGLMRANILSANLRGADLSGSDFSRADFSFSDLSGANLAGAKLSGAEFSGTDMRGAIHLCQHGLLEIHPSQIADQARTRQVRPLQIGALKLHRKHHRALQIGVGEVRAFGKADREIAPREVGARKVAAVQYRRREIRSFEIDARQVQPGEIFGIQIGRSGSRSFGQRRDDLFARQFLVAGPFGGARLPRQQHGRHDEPDGAEPSRAEAHFSSSRRPG